jgi:hypothetical protein
MKWYNKDKTRCLDLDKISYWIYNNYGGYISTGELKIYMNSSEPLIFHDEEAKEIYEILISQQKEVIQG